MALAVCCDARAVLRHLVVIVVAVLVLLGAERLAFAETLQAPVGGAPFLIGDGRVACGRAPGGWAIEDAGKLVRPPANASAAGSLVELRVAATFGGCASSSSIIKLAATAPWPVIQAGAFTLAIDDGRLSGRGRSLTGTSVSWPAERGLDSSSCSDPAREGDVETCTWTVPKTLPADPRASVLRWWPAGAQIVDDAVMFDAKGKKAAPETFAITPNRVEVTTLLPPRPTVDVSSGVGRVPIVHPDIVESVDCRSAHCTVNGGILEVQAPPAAITAVDVQFRLASHVFDVRKTPPETQPVFRIPVLRCPMEVASGQPLRGVDGARLVVRLEGACMRDVGALGFLVDTRDVDVGTVVKTKDAAFVVLEVGVLRAPEITVMAVRGRGDGSVVALARTETRAAPVVRSVLEIPEFPPIDFIPRNRPAIVHTPRVPGGVLVLRSVPDVYEATIANGVTLVQGNITAEGLVALQFGYRAPGLPPPLDQLDLAVLNDALQRGVKEVDIPAPAEPLVDLLCVDATGKVFLARPGITLRMPFAARNGCRVVIHRERLSRKYGTQKFSLEIRVERPDGSLRPDAHVTKTLIVRHGTEPVVAWIKGVEAPFDRIVVRLSHIADEAHYLGALEIITDEPGVQWTVAFPGGHVRLYATTVIPTGLYRFGVGEHGSTSSGPLTISVGALSRLTWLDRSGKEGLLAVEAGVLAFGLAGDVAPATGRPLFQIGAVAGLGLSLPIANAGGPAQAAINLHVWFEQLLSGSGGTRNLSDQAIIFGPSISLGNVGTTF